MDMVVLDNVPMQDLNYETVSGYRNRHRTLRPMHPFERLDDAEYLRCIGAAAISDEDKRLHPTVAGMLMFGDEYNIVRQFPECFWISGKCSIRQFDGLIAFSQAPGNGLEISVIFILGSIIRLFRISRFHSRCMAGIE